MRKYRIADLHTNVHNQVLKEVGVWKGCTQSYLLGSLNVFSNPLSQQVVCVGNLLMIPLCTMAALVLFTMYFYIRKVVVMWNLVK